MQEKQLNYFTVQVLTLFLLQSHKTPQFLFNPSCFCSNSIYYGWHILLFIFPPHTYTWFVKAHISMGSCATSESTGTSSFLPFATLWTPLHSAQVLRGQLLLVRSFKFQATASPASKSITFFCFSSKWSRLTTKLVASLYSKKTTEDRSANRTFFVLWCPPEN